MAPCHRLFPCEFFLCLLYKVLSHCFQTVRLMVILLFDLWTLQLTSHLLPLWSEKLRAKLAKTVFKIQINNSEQGEKSDLLASILAFVFSTFWLYLFKGHFRLPSCVLGQWRLPDNFWSLLYTVWMKQTTQTA